MAVLILVTDCTDVGADQPLSRMSIERTGAILEALQVSGIPLQVLGGEGRLHAPVRPCPSVGRNGNFCHGLRELVRRK